MRKVRLGDLGQIITGNTPSKNHLEFYEGSDIPFIKPDDFESLNSISTSLNHKSYISEKARSKARIIPKQSVLVTCIGIIGKVMISETEVSFNQQINAIIPNNLILAKYLAYQLIFNQNKLNFIANAPVVPIVNKTQFSDFEIQIHDDIKQQKVIVTILENIDSQIIQRRQQLTQFNNLVKSRFYEQFGDLSTNPYGFPIVYLSEIAEYYNGLTYKPEMVVEDGSGTIVLRSSNIQDSKLDFNDIVRVNIQAKEKNIVRKNDILMCSRNGSERLVGKTAIINTTEKMYFGAFMMLIRSKYFEFLQQYFQTEHFRSTVRQGATTTINQITVKMMDKVKIPLPPLALQNQFADFVAEVDKSQLACQKSLDELETLKKSLMQAYFG